MSWAEDNGIDVDYGFNDGVGEGYLENLWREGEHETRDGENIKLSEMTTQHLKNTINYFDSLDTTPLEKELKRRKFNGEEE